MALTQRNACIFIPFSSYLSHFESVIALISRGVQLVPLANSQGWVSRSRFSTTTTTLQLTAQSRRLTNRYSLEYCCRDLLVYRVPAHVSTKRGRLSSETDDPPRLHRALTTRQTLSVLGQLRLEQAVGVVVGGGKGKVVPTATALPGRAPRSG
ncbi:hypothetical protein J6590_050491 [Homalodisca vitripennis]|nr:hypothetical protein J6590_050491 [Homalodisca vitripennis]